MKKIKKNKNEDNKEMRSEENKEHDIWLLVATVIQKRKRKGKTTKRLIKNMSKIHTVEEV